MIEHSILVAVLVITIANTIALIKIALDMDELPRRRKRGKKGAGDAQ